MERQRDAKTEKDIERQRETERQRGREKKKHMDRQRRKRDGAAETQKHREADRHNKIIKIPIPLKLFLHTTKFSEIFIISRLPSS